MPLPCTKVKLKKKLWRCLTHLICQNYYISELSTGILKSDILYTTVKHCKYQLLQFYRQRKVFQIRSWEMGQERYQKNNQKLKQSANKICLYCNSRPRLSNNCNDVIHLDNLEFFKMGGPNINFFFYFNFDLLQALNTHFFRVHLVKKKPNK